MCTASEFRVFVAELSLQFSIFTDKVVTNSFTVLLLAPFLLYFHFLPSFGNKMGKKEAEIYTVNNLDADRYRINIS